MATRLHHILYFLREALINMRRNILLNLMAIGMIAVSLSIFGIFWLIYGNLHAVAKRWTSAVHLVVYLNDGVTEQQRLELDAKIRGVEYVADLTYVSPDIAMKRFKARLADQAYLLEGLQTNPLPASYEIQLDKKHRDLNSVRTVADTLQQFPHVEDIQYGEKWLENLTTLLSMLKLVGLFLGVFLFLTVIFIISNTIKLTLYSREEEINIMKFIGATETFIKGPFLAEGIVRGLFGALFSLVLLFLLYRAFQLVGAYSAHPLILFSGLSFLSWPASVAITLLGSVLGWCGSLLTLHKFLKTY